MSSDNSQFAGIFDLSDPIRDIYLSVMKSGDMSIKEFIERESPEIEEMEIKIYFNILVRQGYMKKIKVDNVIKYRINSIKRKNRDVPNEIWDLLDDS